MGDAVTVKLSVFWTTSAPVWYAQAETQFSIRKITEDDTKYHHAVFALDPCLCFLHQQRGNIKRFLTGAYKLSECERASELVNHRGLGDSTPTELMNSMLSHLGGPTPCFLFLHQFMQQPPDYVRSPLSMSGIKDYRALSQEANRIYLSGRPRIR